MGRLTRLGYDASILRQAPHAGTARYARELLVALRAGAPRDAHLVTLEGWPRWRPTGRWARRPRRVVNLLADTGWLTFGALAATASERLDAWFGPANSLPLALPRPGVVTIHDVNFLSVPELYDPGYARYARSVMQLTVRRARRIVTDSKASRDQLSTRLGVDPGRIRAVYPGADHLASVAPSASPLRLPRPYALFVGQTEPHKNVGLLLDAWRCGVPDGLHLVIAGPPGRDDEPLRRRAAQPGLSGLVHFAGLLDERRLARAYAEASLFLFPSLAEGFGFPPLEAMARGVPTAVSTAGSLPEVTRDGALHFDPHDAAGLAEIVRQMSDDRSLRERLARDGGRVAGGYRWSATASAVWEEVGHAIDD